MVRIKTFHESVLTVIELLIITSVVAIITVFAVPMLSDAQIPSDFKRAIDITESTHSCCLSNFKEPGCLFE